MGDTFAYAGERIRILRQHKHLTQEQLGELAGLNPNYVGQVERGQRTPSVNAIHALAKALGVDPGFLLLSPDKAGSSIDSLIALIALATPEQVELITKIAETVVSSGYQVSENHDQHDAHDVEE
ncbi:MAG: helix-turn-helix transcriptional regulator [Firmicutes bacterium]|jgi:transcriptional regulator with XRE-family HTH domain|nr:helix-turn-helix transcriptional regulator [Bacillota bacterium]